MTITQRHAELSLALRVARSELRADVRTGVRGVADAMGEPCVAKLHVAKILGWQHNWGVRRAECFLVEHEVCSRWQTCGHLTDRQRTVIAGLLSDSASTERLSSDDPRDDGAVANAASSEQAA